MSDQQSNRPRLVTVLEPSDELTHEPDPVPNYNESMYLNAFDPEAEVGGWFRLGNRVNEGYAEMTVCTYLPGGRVGFMYGRPRIETNDAMDAGGLRIDVVEPFEHLRVTYDGTVCLLDEPGQMADPRTAFRDNPHVGCRVDLDIRGASPMYGGRPVHEDGTEPELDAERSFAKAHYEQHTTSTGTIQVGDEVLDIAGIGLRDKSWGPRYWQALSWYRWLPMSFGPDFAMMLSVIGDGERGARRSGMVLVDGEYHQIRDCEIVTDWDDRGYQTAMRATAHTDHDTYEVEGEVISLIPLRNRRTTPDGDELTTRITEAMTRYRCGDRRGIGMSEYLDQVVDGRPIGPDVEMPDPAR
ncbi:MAG: hypothetical protein ACLFRV_15505 [Acidimicrobiales bacterium]